MPTKRSFRKKGTKVLNCFKQDTKYHLFILLQKFIQSFWSSGLFDFLYKYLMNEKYNEVIMFWLHKVQFLTNVFILFLVLYTVNIVFLKIPEKLNMFSIHIYYTIHTFMLKDTYLLLFKRPKWAFYCQRLAFNCKLSLSPEVSCLFTYLF